MNFTIQLKNLVKQLRALMLTLQKLLKAKQGKSFEEFALALRKRESSNNYDAVNAYGYLGAYQFGMARLCDLGFTERKAGTTGYSNSIFRWKTGYSKEHFLNNPNFQDRVFKKHCINLISQIERKFSQYLGTQVGGIKITLSGLVAGAHLGGIGGVDVFLRGISDCSDALGTRISNYIEKFGGYNV